jgi:hypothetical protein
VAITAFPKPAQSITADQFRDYFREFIGTGARVDADLKPSADSSGMNVKLAPGIGFVDGTQVRSTAIETIPVAAASGGGSRIDTLVANLDYSASPIIQFAVIAGSPSVTPARPSLALSGSIAYRWPIADIAVGATASTITAANVTDRRTLVGRTVITWTTATRPSSPANGQLGFNLTTSEWEWRDGSAWVPLLPVLPTWTTLSGRPNVFPPSVHDIDERHSGVLPLNKGGTGGTNATTARASLDAADRIHNINTSHVGTLLVAGGGTGATSATGARNNLGAAAASHEHDISDITQDGLPIMTNYLPLHYQEKIGAGFGAPSGGSDGDIYLRVI